MEAYAASYETPIAQNLHKLLKSFRTLSKGFNELDATRAILLSGIPPRSEECGLHREGIQSLLVRSIHPGDFGLTGPQNSEDSPRMRAWTPIGSSRHFEDLVSDMQFKS